VVVEKVVSQCVTCAKSKDTTNSQHAKLPLPASPGRWQVVAADFLMGLPLVRDVDQLLVVIDQFSHRVELLPCNRHVTSEQTVQMFKEVFGRHGYPKLLYVDADSKFTAAVFKTFCVENKIELYIATTQQHVSLAERAVKTVQTGLRALAAYGASNWPTLVPDVEFAINSLKSTTTGVTPFMMDLGYNPSAPGMQHLFGTPAVDIPALQDKQRSVIVRAQEALLKARELQTELADATHVKPEIEVGDSVYVSTKLLQVDASRNQHTKLAPKYVGPFLVLERRAHGNFLLALPYNSKAQRVFHESKLKKGPASDAPRPGPVDGIEERGYRVEAIIDSRMKGKTKQYLTLWQGYPMDEATWLPLSRLQTCLELVSDFEAACALLRDGDDDN
jgi:hypothetical protein